MHVFWGMCGSVGCPDVGQFVRNAWHCRKFEIVFQLYLQTLVFWYNKWYTKRWKRIMCCISFRIQRGKAKLCNQVCLCGGGLTCIFFSKGVPLQFWIFIKCTRMGAGCCQIEQYRVFASLHQASEIHKNHFMLQLK